MKKIIFIVIIAVGILAGGLIIGHRRPLDVADDAYYTVIGSQKNTEDILVASTNIDKDKEFKIDTKKFDLEKYKDGQVLKILVNTEDTVLDIQEVNESDLPGELKLSDID